MLAEEGMWHYMTWRRSSLLLLLWGSSIRGHLCWKVIHRKEGEVCGVK
ncbi:unnamed protein product [Amoebophrya sp. A25]|nr:unnamed protein product [Amoebophrya sp. A25]|eukprot:GSA25T00023728001.1